ncbi:hypothetical protein [Thiorhodovibrio frisius]|uniref:hypothetical protein n=1 Tax=Thiorhodovibrio frisius TaxID=631362 RepID=UPI00022C770D|nr:hypothetical protein [Thiorhodovibrio frisius]WPL20084.1 3-deoxy-manno-octulosonate cytidylyltransferase [Thiorhodovibrio frisius]
MVFCNTTPFIALQLRWLAAGVRIRAFEVEPTGPGVDTPDCLARVRALLAGAPDAGFTGIATGEPLQRSSTGLTIPRGTRE